MAALGATTGRLMPIAPSAKQCLVALALANAGLPRRAWVALLATIVRQHLDASVAEALGTATHASPPILPLSPKAILALLGLARSGVTGHHLRQRSLARLSVVRGRCEDVPVPTLLPAATWLAADCPVLPVANVAVPWRVRSAVFGHISASAGVARPHFLEHDPLALRTAARRIVDHLPSPLAQAEALAAALRPRGPIGDLAVLHRLAGVQESAQLVLVGGADRGLAAVDGVPSELPMPRTERGRALRRTLAPLAPIPPQSIDALLARVRVAWSDLLLGLGLTHLTAILWRHLDAPPSPFCASAATCGARAPPFPIAPLAVHGLAWLLYASLGLNQGCGAPFRVADSDYCSGTGGHAGAAIG
mmetsp:Transcript_36227/g.104391  ORF Transcript_36227/g.104391 Transcript_36227/m.104391 type:complete len:362 (-) Transcript_36227:102-1187(-)